MTADPDISRQDSTQPQVLGVLALELSDDSVPARGALGQQAAGTVQADIEAIGAGCHARGRLEVADKP